jgi:hypothetical protein
MNGNRFFRATRQYHQVIAAQGQYLLSRNIGTISALWKLIFPDG